MQEIIGKYTTAQVFARTIEDECVQQIYDICNSPGFSGTKIRIMPDTHSGSGSVIGFTSTFSDYVDPRTIGVDIGCTISAHKFSKPIEREDFVLFEHRIKEAVPMGFSINDKPVIDEKTFYKFLNTEYQKARSMNPDMIEDVGRIDEKYIMKMIQRIGMDTGIFYKSIGSVGGGNHFIEIDEKCVNGEKEHYLLIHCGSRNFGVKVCNYWHKIAQNPKVNKEELKAKIAEIKANCTDRKLLKGLIDQAKKDAVSKNPNGFLSGDNLRGYISDMVIAQAYARFNHITIRDRIFEIAHKFNNIKCEESIFTTHNYIDFTTDTPIIRKGAISAKTDEIVIIPFNMAFGVAVCRGKGNEDYNCSAPHGAGRIMSRTAAKKNISMYDFKESMKDVYSTTVCSATLDESPQAYKDPNEILELIEPTVDVLFLMKPIINIKATESEDMPWKKK